jgi:UDP-N-acetylmuramate--alanine ligase
VGIKGAGMAALAQVVASHGVSVTGSDTNEVFFTDEILRNVGIPVFENFSSKHITYELDAVVYSTAYHRKTHEEIVQADNLHIPTFSYPEFVGKLSEQKLSVAICGTHGKTTTTAMIAHILSLAHKEPSAIVGSSVLNWQSGALAGTGPHFVFEADEYQNKFQYYAPWSVALTNVGYDHGDFFPTKDLYERVFSTFLKKVPKHGFLVVCEDDAGAMRVSEAFSSRRITYGFHKNSTYRAEIVSTKKEAEERFRVIVEGEVFGEFSIQLWGRHNITNATGAIALLDTMGVSVEDIAKGLADFRGTARRMEKKGIYNGALVFDDYAHHPEEISATLAAARNHFQEKSIVVIFQPHTFSRTETFADEFAESLSTADAVLLLDIYTSAREHAGSISSDDIVRKINAIHSERAANMHTAQRAADIVRKSADDNTVIITMGAGDVWQVGELLLNHKKIHKG